MHSFIRSSPSPDPHLSIPIPEDPQERERIRLEQDLSRDLRELSFDPSATSQDYSVEYPRHGGDGLRSPGFPSFHHQHHSHDISFDPTPNRPQNDVYSHHGDDSLATGGDTGSTTNHHASAVTFGAGLGYRGARSLSRSGVAGAGEYDPDRQLQDMLNAPRGNMSLFEDSRVLDSKADQSLTPKPRNKKAPRRSDGQGRLSFDPIIVEDTAELDRAVESGYVHPDSSFHRSEPGSPLYIPTHQQRKPVNKLSEALLNFSPQRPRTTQTQKTRNAPQSTTTSGGSQFERLARGLAKEIEEERRDGFVGRVPLGDIVNSGRAPKVGGKGGVQLPDVTGLTSALATPDKASANYRDPGTVANEADVSVVNEAIEELATRLRELEKENGTSRRRVRELELELDACKAEVVRERTRVKEEVMKGERNRTKERERDADRKGKGKATAGGEVNWEARYCEVLEEKKALEALVETLRTHLARTTAELESHQNLVQSLRDLRHQDALEIEEKCREVEELREEVEKLGQEVERLRGVVEEGLRERRRLREGGEMDLSALPSKGQVYPEEQPETDYVPPSPPVQRPQHPIRPFSRQQGMRRPSSPRPSTPIMEEVSMERRRKSRFAPQRAEVERVDEDIVERQSSRSYGSENGHHSLEQQPSRSSTPRPEYNPIEEPPRQPRSSRRAHSTFPRIRGDRLEKLFFSAPEHDRERCHACNRRKKARTEGHDEEVTVNVEWLRERLAARAEDADGRDRLPPQTVLARVLRELEDDFSHYKSIYMELADQYKVIDAASNTAKRNVLAAHLKEVIDTLEQKGDQIASLYDLLRFEDRPLP